MTEPPSHDPLSIHHGAVAGDLAAGDEDPVETIRHEERLHVGTESVATERVRLQKYIVSEERTITVTVRREEVRVLREPLPPGTSAPQAGTQRPVDLTLHEEQVVTSVRVVPVERVRLAVTRVQSHEVVAAVLRSERIGIEGDAPAQ